VKYSTRPRFVSGAEAAVVVTTLALITGCGAADDLPTVDVGDAPPAQTDELRTSHAPKLKWVPCGEDTPGFECAVAAVPLDYDAPRGPKTGVALAKFPASDPDNKIGTLFINPGGPGGSGVGFAFGFAEVLESWLGGRFDVIGFDPRGVGASEPLRCFDTLAEIDPYLDPGFPYLPEQRRPYFETQRALGKICLGRGQRIASHMSTADVVRDLDWLRQAVGDAKLSYLGFSYGSYIGNTYANMFPDKVRALAIDGVLDPRLWSSGWQILSDRVASDETLAEFFRLCDEAASDCPFGGPEGSAAQYRALADALLEAPLVDEDGFVFGYDELIGITAGALYQPEVWVDAAALFALLAEAVAGEVSAVETARASYESLRERLSGTPGPSEPEAPAEEYPNDFDAFLGNHCADAEYPRTFAEFRAIGALAEKNSLFGPYWWWFNAGCSAWPVSKDRYLGPWTARTSAPVLVIGNYFDPSTHYDGAVASSKLLKNSRLLSYAGWGHTAFARSACVTDYTLDYLLEGVLPPKGTVCPENPNPFLPVPELRVARALAPIGLPPSWVIGRPTR